METRVMKLCCQGCGADLQVTEDLRFVTCNYCQSKLEIVRDASVTHTRVLEKLEKTTERIAGNLRVIELQNDLERLDREWDRARDGMMIRGEEGRTCEPSTARSVVGGMMGIVGGIIFAVSSGSMGAPAFFPLFGMIIVAVGIVQLVAGSAKASRFRDLKYRYEAQRARMLGLIEKERRR